MRRGLQQAIHLNNERRRLQVHVAKGDGDPKVVAQLNDVNGRLLDLLVEELVHQSRDVVAATVAAKRRY